MSLDSESNDCCEISVQEQLQNLVFPLNGLDLTSGFGGQRPGTTPVGINVRAFEPGTQRGRGGSRHGLSKYVLPQLPTAGKIQCLDYIVDPSASALLASFGNGGPGDPGAPDPSTNPSGSSPGDGRFRNPGNIWRTGGSGIQPNRNTTLTINNPYTGVVQSSPSSQKADGSSTSVISIVVTDRYGIPTEDDSITLTTSPSGRVGDGSTGTTNGAGECDFTVTNNTIENVTYTCTDTTHSSASGSATVNWGGWQFVQGDAVVHQGGSSSTFSRAYPVSVTSGNLLVAASWPIQAPARVTSITDTQGNIWTRIAESGVIGITSTKSLWYTVAGSSGANTITYHFSASTGVALSGIAEYSGNSATPLDQFTVGGSAATTTWSSGSIGISSSNAAVVVAYFGSGGTSGFGSYSATPPAILRDGDEFNDTPPSTGNNFVIQMADDLNVTASNDTVTITTNLSNAFTSLGASFK